MNDYNFHIETQGNSKNTPLLFLHGFMGNGDDFQTIISSLAHDFYCLAIDLPGHGKTKINGRDDCYKMKQTGNAIADVLETMNIPHCNVLGYSMGGRLALYLALHFPHKFPKIILESASPGLKTPLEQEKRREKDAQLANILETRSLEHFLKNWYQNSLFSSLQNHAKFETKFELIFERMVQRRMQNDPILLAKSLRHLGTGQQPALWDKLKTLQNPLLLLVGALDPKFTAIATQMQRLSPLIQLQIVENCGHNIHLEDPKQFIKKVKYFLNAS